MAEGGRRSSSSSSDDELPWRDQRPSGWDELDSPFGGGGLNSGSTSADEEFQWEELMVKSQAGTPPDDKTRTFSIPRVKSKVDPRLESKKPKGKKSRRPSQGVAVGESGAGVGNWPPCNPRPRSQLRLMSRFPSGDDTYDVPQPPMLAPLDPFGNPVENVSSESDFEEVNIVYPPPGERRGARRPSRREESPELLRHATFINQYDKTEYGGDGGGGGARGKSRGGGRTKSKNWLKSPGVASKLTSMKELSGSFKSLMSLKSGGGDKQQQRLRRGERGPVSADLMSPREVFNTFLGSGMCPSFKNAFFLYLEGSMGVGKTTLIKHMCEMNGDNVVSFVEPMVYWREVYSDCVKQIYGACKPYNVGKMSTSNKVLAAQTKFMTPMKCLQTSVRRYVRTEEPLQEKNPMDNWVLFDRHLLSATLVFPYLFLKNGHLSFEHFLALAANFRAHEGDVIALLCMLEEDNLKMVKNRNRKSEGGVTSGYLKDLGLAFHACYCTWLLLKYLSPEDMVSVCCCDVSLSDICIMKSMSNSKLTMARNLFTKSMFPTLMDVIQPFKSNCTIIEICLTLFLELKKVEFIVVNASEFINDIPGVWTSIYTQSLRTQAIKTQSVDWCGLRAFSQTYNS
nr:thymidine kinase [Equid gammaherpesvirus 5]UTK45550.1 thymidine kinase [Equid gammaherpesvirus 5]UTK45629.1 thymidine kinase [Equid gammaherpesvirus 5]UTK45708.1 thymidine kinase [Equid gammaherpesvirus 5]